jgi:hypothetical protein
MDFKIKIHSNLHREYGNEDSIEGNTPPQKSTMEFFNGDDNSKIHIFVENTLRDHTKISDDKIKVAFIREIDEIYEYACLFQPEPYNPYTYLSQNIEHFDYVIGCINYKYFSDIIDKDRFIFCHHASTRVKPDTWGIYEKDKMLSIIASSKDWTIGHRLRHWVINKYKNDMDIYGRGYNTIIDSVEGGFGKIYGLAPYRFHLVILNSLKEGWYTEALIDAFACGCIPILYGCKEIDNYFNPEGIIRFESMPQLENIIKNLTPELYNSKIAAVKENLNLAKKYSNHHDYLYNDHMNDFKLMTKK